MQQRKSTFDCIRLDFQSKSSPYCTGRVEMTFSKKLAVLEATDQLQLLLPESNNQRGRSFKRANQPIHWKINYFPLRYPRAGTVPPNYFSCFHGKFLFSIESCVDLNRRLSQTMEIYWKCQLKWLESPDELKQSWLHFKLGGNAKSSLKMTEPSTEFRGVELTSLHPSWLVIRNLLNFFDKLINTSAHDEPEQLSPTRPLDRLVNFQDKRLASSLKLISFRLFKWTLTSFAF